MQSMKGIGPENQTQSHTLHAAVFNQAMATPLRPAVIDESGIMDYQCLRHAALSIAQQLSALNLAKETAVGVYLPRDRHIPASLLGIMAADCAYLPLDPKHPQARTELLLEIAQAKYVITTTALASRLPDTITPVFIDENGRPNEAILQRNTCATQLAYFIFTSGSTGVPKGVMIEHGNALSLIDWAHQTYTDEQLSQVACGTSITFDLSVFEIFAPLTQGGCVHMLADPLALLQWHKRDDITLFNTVPSVINEMVKIGELPSHLPIINLAGEPLPMHLVHTLRRQCPTAKIFNLYGPSEDTTYSTGGEVLASDPHPTIGTPLTGRRCYLLDAEGNAVAPGETGEIYVAGPGVARGYYHRPELNDAFLPDPAGPKGARMYRTGDYGKQLEDGRLLYLGRRDDQVKIRGHRIEIGEIDAVLRRHPGVREVAVVVVESANKGKSLRCALELHSPADRHAIIAWAATQLPVYMLPAEWMAFDELPRLPNGKIDRGALRHCRTQHENRAGQAPEGATELSLAGLWRQLLDCADVYRTDTFFGLGGHSLLLARLAHEIKKQFSADLAIERLLAADTLSRQARLIEQWTKNADAPPCVSHTRQTTLEAPCSPSQSRMWMLEKLLPGSPRYNIPAAFQIVGPLDLSRLSNAAEQVVMQHTILRTRYAEGAQGLQQCVAQTYPPVVHHENLCEWDEKAAWEQAWNRANAFARTAFDLTEEIPFKVLALKIKQDLHLVVLLTHHIAVDGSMDILLAELSAAYENTASDASPAPLSYQDYCHWLTQCESRQTEALAYWQRQLAEPPAAPQLPCDRPLPRQERGQGRQLSVPIPEDKFIALSQLCRRHEVSVFHGLLALIWAYLGRLADTDDVLLTAPLQTRNNHDFAATIGNFVNTVILRGDMRHQPRVGELLRQARQRTQEAMQFGQVPYETVLDNVKGLRTANGTPALNVMLSLQQEQPLWTMRDTGSSHLPIDLLTSRFSLGFFFRLSNGGLELNLEYDTERFTDAAVQRLIGHWFTLMSAALANDEAVVTTLPLLSDDERHNMLDGWNATQCDYAGDRLVHQLFEAQASQAPHHIALCNAQNAMSYAELYTRANRLAHYLLAQGFDAGARIAILCDRSPAMVIAMLAILKAGCVYVPFDPASPPARFQAMIRIAGITGIATDALFADTAAALIAQAPTSLAHVHVAISEDLSWPSTPVESRITSDALAYIIFTSGTTGDPKAVAVRHKPVINLIEWVNKTFTVNASDKSLFVTSLAFDLSVYDLLGMLAAGGTIRLAGRDETKDPSTLANIVCAEGITFWNSAPIALDQCEPYFPPYPIPSLRLAFLSGDWIPVSLPDKLRKTFPNLQLVGLGGATEAVIWSNFFIIERVAPEQSSIPYGKPIQNARYYILDKQLQPVPIAVEGDLFIGGEVLAEGYFGDQEKTARSYLPDPYGLTPTARMYRTGDRARFFPDGTIEFLGRQDTQIKINGYRIETGEIEAALLTQPGINGACVVVKGERHRLWLCAYIVSEEHNQEAIARLRANLRTKLPEYMIPAVFTCLSAFPLTANGKLDKQRLPEPITMNGGGDRHAPPTGHYETTIADIWKHELNCEALNATDNFFDLGGNSASLIRTHRTLENALNRTIPIVTLFQYTTLRSLAEWLAGNIENDAAGASQATEQRLSGRQRLMQQRKQRITAND